jgi:multiple sugar transport system permease protein
VGLIFVAVIWQFLFQKDVGIINYYLSQLGIGPVGWLSNPNVALVSVIILDVWKNVGFAMLIAIAGLQNISSDYYDAAKVDGASAFGTFWRITIPLLSPTILFLVTMNTIGAFKVFESIVVLTNGGPGDATRSLVMYIYEQGFKSLNMGYASAISLLLLAVIVIITALQFFLSRKWAFYE